MRSACEMLSVSASASCCSPPSIRTACCSLPYKVAVSCSGTPMRWAMANNCACATAYSCWPAVASFRRAAIMFQASAIWMSSWTLPAAQLMVRKASNWPLARLTCSPNADIPALTSAMPAAACLPDVRAVADNPPSDFSAAVMARWSPLSAPSSATRTEMRLAMPQSTVWICFSMRADRRGIRPATSRSTLRRFLSCTRGTSTAIGTSAPRFRRLMPSAWR